MCGIFGTIKTEEANFENDNLEKIIDNLLIVSQSRGKDSSGFALLNDDTIDVYKDSVSASTLIKTKTYHQLLEKAKKINAVMGHARMETNGTFTVPYNNQPVVKDGCVSIHNGIIVNDTELWGKFPDIKREYQVDTEVMNSLFRKFLKEESNIIDAFAKTFNLLDGSFSIATFFTDLDYVLLATNNGSLYLLENKDGKSVIFASEEPFLHTLVKKSFGSYKNHQIRHLEPGRGYLINTKTLEKIEFEFDSSAQPVVKKEKKKDRKIVIVEVEKNIKRNEEVRILDAKDNLDEVKKIINEEYENNISKVKKLRRCTRCILPETMPYIKFDPDGICNYCLTYKKVEVKGENELMEIVEKYRRSDGRPDVVAAFSGGRDSSFGLHYIKNVLKMTPLAFSYDWGMLTDLGRRNQARMTGKLGIEHILVSADIHQKRKNIQLNVLAWLKRPHLGTIPLFMAGDKQYFYHANRIKKDYGIELVIMGENYYEKTIFKNGFAGIKQDNSGFMAYHVSSTNKLKMLGFYFNQFLKNPAYVNASMLDSFGAFSSYFIIKHDYLNMFDYLKWDEGMVESALKLYDWEYATDTDTSWRIGDGTAAFYNYIYNTVTGFSEIDTFRSNQVREGEITRDEALKLAERDNKPRSESIKWYCDTIGVDMKYAIETINQIPKLYEKS